MKKAFLTTAILSILLLTNCKKEETTKAKTKTEHLTSAKWYIKTFTVDPGIMIGGVTVTDFYSQMDACDKDDSDKFNVGGAGISDEGATKCDPTDPQTTAFTWSLSPTETRFNMDQDIYDIITLDETDLKYSQIVDGDDIGGVSDLKYKITVGCKH